MVSGMDRRVVGTQILQSALKQLHQYIIAHYMYNTYFEDWENKTHSPSARFLDALQLLNILELCQEKQQ